MGTDTEYHGRFQALSHGQDIFILEYFSQESSRGQGKGSDNLNIQNSQHLLGLLNPLVLHSQHQAWGQGHRHGDVTASSPPSIYRKQPSFCRKKPRLPR